MRPGERVARRYAKALFMIGLERGNPAAMLGELDDLTNTIVESDVLRRVLFTPIHPRAARRGVLVELVSRLGGSAELRAVGGLLVEENRTRLLPAIRDALRQEVERAAGRVSAEIESARPLDERQLQGICAALARRMGAEVTVSASVNPQLIGGVLARVGHLRLDGSVRTQLASLAGQLNEEAT